MNTLTFEGLDHVIAVRHDVNLPYIEIEHDGGITFDEMQEIKNTIWGKEAVAIEVFPPQSLLVNTGNFRHIWKLGDKDFWPSIADSGTKKHGTLAEQLAFKGM